jgi:hyperosmotically inducible protein
LNKHLMIALAFLFMAGFAACETDHGDEMTETDETVVTEDNGMADDNEEMAEADDEDRTVGEVLDDTVITSAIKAELLADSDVSGLDIDVDTMEGNVTLSGTVESEMESVEAEAIAKSVDGVVSVTNNLVVDETPDEDMDDTDAKDMDTDNTEENTPDGQGY